MKEGLSNGQKMEWAKLLYTQHNMSIKDVAQKVEVSEAELRYWIKEGRWDGIKKSLIITKEEQLDILYELLGSITARIKESEIDDTKDVDKVLKLTNSIKNLETETGVAEVIDVAKDFISWLQDEDPAEVVPATQRFNKFIKYKEKKH
jgi:transposase-like protein